MKPSSSLFPLLLCVTIGCSDSGSNGAPGSGIGGGNATGGNPPSGGSLALSGVGGSATGSDRPQTGGAPVTAGGGSSDTTGGASRGSNTGGSFTSTGGNAGAGGIRASGGITSAIANTAAGGSSSTKATGGAPTGGTRAAQGGSDGTGGASAGTAQVGGSSPGSGGTRAVQGGTNAVGGTSAQQSSLPPTGGSGAGGAACDPAVSNRNRTLVSKAIDELFVSKDITAADRYWSDPYLQHNPIAKSGVSTFRSLMGSLISSASFSYQRYLTLAECDLAVVYGRYSQSGIIFDMFRVKDDKIIEHWDSDANQASETSQVGTLDPNASSSTHRQLFLDLAAAVLVGAERSRASEFLSASYVDHRNTGATGPNALATLLSSENIVYTRVHHVIADGNFVFALSEGKRGSTSYGFYDLFRADSSLFVERWDSRRSVPNSTASGLGIF